MTRIKICGITNLDDALAAVDAGVDALGFCFSPGPRRITPEQAREIVRAVPSFMITVGVFRNAPADEVCETVDRVGLDCVQLDGGESPDYCTALGRCVIKRFAIADGESAADVGDRIQPYHVSACLLDFARVNESAERYHRLRGLGARLVVGGSLTADNVAAQALYRRFGFSASYEYWYRARSDEQR